MPFYNYRCGKCRLEKEVRHSMNAKPIIVCECGYLCKKLITTEFSVQNISKDVGDYGDVRTSKPRVLRFKDGHKELFDPGKHGISKGSESDLYKKKTKKPKV